jgi:hypothetical protein
MSHNKNGEPDLVLITHFAAEIMLIMGVKDQLQDLNVTSL